MMKGGITESWFPMKTILRSPGGRQTGKERMSLYA